jgi:hypothetical protein
VPRAACTAPRGWQLAAAAALAACGTRPSLAPVAAPSSGPLSYEFRVNPFPVTDSTGRVLELAFLGGLNVPRPQLVDADGDGDLDLFLQEYSGHVMLLEREGQAPDGLPRFLLRSRRYADLDIGEWYRFSDLDGDGDQDLLSELPYSYVRFWRNAGSRSAPRFVPPTDSLRDADGRALFADRQNILQAADIDCDRLPDLLVGRITGTVVHYEMVAGAASDAPRFRFVTDRFENIEIVAQFGSAHGANTMTLADYDDDGDLDLFWGDFFEQGLLLIENTGTCASPMLRGTPLQFPPGEPLLTSGYNAPTYGDVDADGRGDLIVGVLGGAFNPNRTTIANLHLLGRDAGGRWVARTGQLLPMLDVGSESIPALADLDGDGDLDLLLANKIDPARQSVGLIYLIRNTGSARAPAFRLTGVLPVGNAYHPAPALGDLDGDGDLDLLLGTWSARVGYYRNDGTRSAPAFTPVDTALITITRGSNTTPALGDVDGDGDLDLLVGEASGALNFYRNDGGPATPRLVLVSDTFDGIDVGRRSAPTLADVDGDGDLDLLVGSDAEGVLLFRNEGSRSIPRFLRDPRFRLDVPPLAAPAAGDLDGDGDLDLVVGGVGGGATFFTGSGG